MTQICAQKEEDNPRDSGLLKFRFFNDMGVHLVLGNFPPGVLMSNCIRYRFQRKFEKKNKVGIRN